MTTYPEQTMTRNGTMDLGHDRHPVGRDGDGPDAGTIAVGIINDYEVVVRGVASMLAPYANRIKVVELDAGGAPTVPADVALFDTFAGRRHTLSRAADMVRNGSARHVVLYTWDAAPPFLRAPERSSTSPCRR